MSGVPGPEERALAELVREARDARLPELEWDRVEARLMNEPRPAPGVVPSGFVGWMRWPALGLVAAAAAVFALAPRHAPIAPLAPTASKPVAQVPSGPLNGDALLLGAHVTAGNRGIVVEHAGRARWSLDPMSSSAVTNIGEFLTVRLESGALSATIVPNPKPETFAVEVGGTRVAVHGTAFRVARVGDRVLVEVTEGTVAIEPTSARSDPSFLLRRGSRGNFGLDGRTGSVEGNASAMLHNSGPNSHREIGRVATHAAAHSPAAPATPAQPIEPASAAEPAVRAAPVPALPLQPSISDIESGVSAAVEVLNGCFRDQKQATNVRVSASTAITLSVSGDGSVQSVNFGPPLAPAVEDCAVLGLRNIAFASSVEGATFTRVLELSR